MRRVSSFLSMAGLVAVLGSTPSFSMDTLGLGQISSSSSSGSRTSSVERNKVWELSSGRVSPAGGFVQSSLPSDQRQVIPYLIVEGSGIGPAEVADRVNKLADAYLGPSARDISADDVMSAAGISDPRKLRPGVLLFTYESSWFPTSKSGVSGIGSSRIPPPPPSGYDSWLIN